jgi:hypothetical protein
MAKTTMRISRRGWGRSNRLGAIEVIGPQLHRSLLVQLLLALWRWSIEITLTVLVLIAWFRLRTHMPAYAVAMVMTFPIVAACNFKRGRWLIGGMFYVLLVRHRLRTALVQLGCRNRSGKLPWLVWWHPTPVGARVWLALVAGMSAKQIEESADALAAACWARQVRVDTSRRWTAFVRVDVISRDPLESGNPIGSRLLGPLRRGKQPPATQPVIDMPGPVFGSGSYGTSRLYRAEGHVADSSADTTNNRKPPRASRGGRDEGPDDDGGLSEYV